MKTLTQVFLFGSLKKWGKGFIEIPILLKLPAPATLWEIIEQLKIPPDMVQLPMVNHRAVSWHATIHPGDRVSLFPKEYPIFADWKNFRACPPIGLIR